MEGNISNFILAVENVHMINPHPSYLFGPSDKSVEQTFLFNYLELLLFLNVQTFSHKF